MDRAPFSFNASGTPPVLGPVWANQIYLAEVRSLQDPDNLARVKVRVHAANGVTDQDAEIWARLLCVGAGDNRGLYWVPDVGDLVVVSFLQGDARLPVVMGSLWAGNASPPENMDGNNSKKELVSRNGVKITLDDTDGQEKLILETPGGSKLTLADGPGSCTLEDSNGNSIKMESSGITITASAKVTINASQVAVSAGMVKVDAGMSKFSGAVKCDVLISNTVVSSSYTPGAGNIW